MRDVAPDTVVLDFGIDDQLTIHGASSATLDASHFVLV
jgi:hypothetical protein